MSFEHSSIFRDDTTGMIYGTFKIDTKSKYNGISEEEFKEGSVKIPYTGSFKHFNTVAPVKSIDYGDNHVVFCDNYGSLWVAGSNSDGALGLGNRVEYTSKFTRVPLDTSIILVSTGMNFSIVLDYLGYVWSFGNNLEGGLGLMTDNDTMIQFVPKKIPTISNIQSICSCSNHTLALSTDCTTLWIWGRVEEIKNYPIICEYNTESSTGKLMKVLPKSVLGINFTIKSIATGKYHSLLLDDQQKVWLLGIPLFDYSKFIIHNITHTDSETGPILNYPIMIDHVFPIKSIHCGIEGIYLVREDGEIMVAGVNIENELGLQSLITMVEKLCTSTLLKDMTILSTKAYTLICKDSYGYVHSAGFCKYGQTGKPNTDNVSTFSCTGFRLISAISKVKSANNTSTLSTSYYDSVTTLNMDQADGICKYMIID